jgi:hypothetical protein
MPMPEGRFASLSAATTGTGNAADFAALARELTVFVQGNGTITGGTLVIEEARSPDYTGTWSQIGSAVTPVSNSVQAIHITGCFLALRARVTSNILGGGSVTVEFVGN